MYCSFICFEKPFQNKQRRICIWIYCFVIFIICRHTWLWFILFFVLVDMQFSDGYLDLIIIRDCPKLPLLALMSELNKGNHIKSPYVMYFKVSSFYHLLPHLVFLMFSFPVPPYKLTKSTSSHNLLGYKTPWRTDISLFSLDWEKGKGKREKGKGESPTLPTLSLQLQFFISLSTLSTLPFPCDKYRWKRLFWSLVLALRTQPREGS